MSSIVLPPSDSNPCVDVAQADAGNSTQSISKAHQNSSSGLGHDEVNWDEYPEQKHTGAVGYGPEYEKGAVGPGSLVQRLHQDLITFVQAFDSKLSGLKEQIKGKVTRNPDLVEHGRQQRTGELKKRQMGEKVSSTSMLFEIII